MFKAGQCFIFLLQVHEALAFLEDSSEKRRLIFVGELYAELLDLGQVLQRKCEVTDLD